jgi:hypothetical protein
MKKLLLMTATTALVAMNACPAFAVTTVSAFAGKVEAIESALKSDLDKVNAEIGKLKELEGKGLLAAYVGELEAQVAEVAPAFKALSGDFTAEAEAQSANKDPDDVIADVDLAIAPSELNDYVAQYLDILQIQCVSARSVLDIPGAVPSAVVTEADGYLKTILNLVLNMAKTLDGMKKK